MKVWSALEEFWNKLLNAGCSSDLSALDTIRVRVVNGAATLLTPTQLIIISIRAFYGETFDVSYIFNLLIALLVFPVIYFNSLKYHVIARSLFFIGALFLITFICWDHAVHGKQTNTELILLACSIFSVLLFDGGIRYLSFLAVFFSYIFVVFVRVQTQRSSIGLSRDDLLNPVLAFLTVYILTRLYRMAYDKSQRLVLAKNIELIQQKDQIEIQSKKLQELNEQKDKLFSIISHDLRNPLNSINGLLGLMSKEWITEQDFKQQLPALSRNMIATSDLLNNLLFWSRSQLKGEVHQFSHFDITMLSKSALDSVESQAHQKGIVIQHEVKEAIVYADKDMMAIVLRNLLTNAIKFSSTGQTVLLSAFPVGDYLQVCVSDSGIGIPPEKLLIIFDSGFQSNQGTMREGGTGLGLMLCKDFVDKNNGKIWVESEPGKGSSFYFTIPL